MSILESILEVIVIGIASAVVGLAACFGPRAIFKGTKAKDFPASLKDGYGIGHDPQRPDKEELSQLNAMHVHETILNPKSPVSVKFTPGEDRCTFYLSNGFSCIARAGLVTKNNYYIKWHTLTWDLPLEDLLSPEDAKQVAKAFYKIDPKTIIWPFPDQDIHIMWGENMYTAH